MLGAAQADREAVRSALAALSPPSSVRSAHERLVGVVAQSVDALDSAVTGVIDYQFSDRDTDYDETDGWRAFRADSERISSEYGAATSSWEADVTRRERQVKERKMPKAPEV